jgi:hypothetical protein
MAAFPILASLRSIFPDVLFAHLEDVVKLNLTLCITQVIRGMDPLQAIDFFENSLKGFFDGLQTLPGNPKRLPSAPENPRCIPSDEFPSLCHSGFELDESFLDIPPATQTGPMQQPFHDQASARPFMIPHSSDITWELLNQR